MGYQESLNLKNRGCNFNAGQYLCIFVSFNIEKKNGRITCTGSQGGN